MCLHCSAPRGAAASATSPVPSVCTRQTPPLPLPHSTMLKRSRKEAVSGCVRWARVPLLSSLHQWQPESVGMCLILLTLSCLNVTTEVLITAQGRKKRKKEKREKHFFFLHFALFVLHCCYWEGISTCPSNVSLVQIVLTELYLSCLLAFPCTLLATFNWILFQLWLPLIGWRRMGEVFHCLVRIQACPTKSVLPYHIQPARH